MPAQATLTNPIQTQAELELKYNVPPKLLLLHSQEKDLVRTILLMLARNEAVTLTRFEERNRVFIYYDTPELLLLRQGSTLRQTIYSERRTGDPQRVRITHKTGEAYCGQRTERTFYSTDEIPLTDIPEALEITAIAQHIQQVIQVDNTQYYWAFTYQRRAFTLTLDQLYTTIETCHHKRGALLLAEIEVELKPAEGADLNLELLLAFEKNVFRKKFKQRTFPAVRTQKYTRLAELF